MRVEDQVGAADVATVEFDPTSVSHALERMAAADDLRAKAAVVRSTWQQGYWIVTRAEVAREVFQNPSLFSNAATQPHFPEPGHRFIPEMLDPPEHTAWRQLLGPHFTPQRIAALEPAVRRRCSELVSAIAGRGHCDFYQDFARVFPTSIFMELMGLPASDAPQFLEWEDAILNYSADSDPDGSKMQAAMASVQACFADLLARRRLDPADDIVTACLRWTIGGEPIPEEDLLNMCLLMFMAGLDTVTQQLTYSFLHLATHPEDRARLVADPELVPGAVEELLRYYAIVTPGRRVTRDAQFHGCPFKEGEIVYLPLSALTRDTAEFPDGDHVDLARPTASRHMAFGAGPHRCLGSNLARRELQIALAEWHRQIPDYRLDPTFDPESIVEHAAGGVLGLDRLRLSWDTRA